MADNPHWDGKVHKAVKFGGRFDSRTVEGHKRAARRAAQARRAKAELEALDAEQQRGFWKTILGLFRVGLKIQAQVLPLGRSLLPGWRRIKCSNVIQIL
jgi:hypothetical protein